MSTVGLLSILFAVPQMYLLNSKLARTCFIAPVGFEDFSSTMKTNNESVLGYIITLSDTLQRSSTDVSKNGKILVFLLSSCKHKKLPVLFIFTFLLMLSCRTTLPPVKVFLKSDFMMSEILKYCICHFYSGSGLKNKS